MKWDQFIQRVCDLPVFDLATAVLLSEEPKPQVCVQISRWSRAGKVIPLRRGLYTLSDLYRRAPLSPLLVANEVYRPSYLSCLWALEFHGLVPGAAPTYQSVTTRVTRSFENALGAFTYSSVKRDLFWGYTTRQIEGAAVSVADPEKALLDFWHLTPGEWTVDRLGEMRLHRVNLIDRAKLSRYAARWGTARVRRAASRLWDVPEGRLRVGAGQ